VAAKTIAALYINTIRTFSMEGVQQDNFGFPDTPTAMAPQRWPQAIRT
jgi:hypothetical protein